MNNSLEETILNGVAQEINKIIEDVREEESLSNDSSSIKILIKVNKRIDSWMTSARELINVDDSKIEATINQAKMELTRKAKEEAANEIAQIVVSGHGNVTERVAEYTDNLKKQGFYLDEEEKEHEVTNYESTPVRSKKLARDLINESRYTRTSGSSPRSSAYDSGQSYGCSGGSSGCGGGGC